MSKELLFEILEGDKELEVNNTRIQVYDKFIIDTWHKTQSATLNYGNRKYLVKESIVFTGESISKCYISIMDLPEFFYKDMHYDYKKSYRRMKKVFRSNLTRIHTEMKPELRSLVSFMRIQNNNQYVFFYNLYGINKFTKDIVLAWSDTKGVNNYLLFLLEKLIFRFFTIAFNGGKEANNKEIEEGSEKFNKVMNHFNNMIILPLSEWRKENKEI